MRRLILRSFQSPGDVLLLTAAVRDLHLACPGQFQTDVRTSADDLWANNPRLTPLRENEPGVEVLEMHYPSIHQSNQRPYHFLHGYPLYLEEKLGVRIPVTRFHGDIHLGAEEKQLPDPIRNLGIPERFWIIVGGGKSDFTAKWWDPASYQKVVDHFAGRIQFVQCGEQNHWHPPLQGVINLVSKTSLREFVRLMYHAEGVVCPVTLAMHLAAAVETKSGGMKHRPCVVIAGGREPPHWESYPHHQFLSTVGALSCCAEGGCWRSRCQLVGDGDEKDRRNVCEQPVQVSDILRIPKCLHMITPEDVIRRVSLYFEGGMLTYTPVSLPVQPAAMPQGNATPSRTSTTKQTISVAFHHGLGDCAHFAHLIPLYLKRGYEVEVECTPDKRLLFEAAGATTVTKGARTVHPWGYPSGGAHVGHGRFWQGSKIGHNISEPPLPHIGDKAALWDEYSDTRIDIESRLPESAKQTAQRYLASLPRPIVLLHTKGNTGQNRKSLPDATAVEFYKALLDQFDGTLVLLDWDNRVPRLASYRVRHLDELGVCPTEVLFALYLQSELLIGVDSGPLHAARFTNIPTVGLWMPGHYPSTYTVPRRAQANVVLSDHTQQWNRFKRIPWSLVEHPGTAFDPQRLAGICARMLQPARYLSTEFRGPDLQLQHFILEWCRGVHGNALSPYSDRNRSFDLLFREIKKRFSCPVVIETGTIRAEEDWSGTGFFTYLAGAFLLQHGGVLHSVDIGKNNCTFARTWTEIFGKSVQIHQSDSIGFLRSFSQSIDVLYLDSLDTTEPGHADHTLRELEATYEKLHSKSIVVLDDTPWAAGAFLGKGARAVPWLLERGWKILYGGYQVVLSRSE